MRPLHNDPTLTVALNLSVVLDSDSWGGKVNPNEFVDHERSGSWQKSKFVMVHFLFTKAHYSWTLSGQIEADNTSFVKLVPRKPNATTISQIGKYCDILFHAFKLSGTPGIGITIRISFMVS